MEIIAKREVRNSILFPSISVICAAVCVVLGFYTDNFESLIFMSVICGGIFIVFGVYSFFNFKTPKIIITRQMNELCVLGVNLEIKNVTDVQFCVDTLFKSGRLQIYTTTSSYICKNVKNVVRAFETVYGILRNESPDSRPARDNAHADNRTYVIARKNIRSKLELGIYIFVCLAAAGIVCVSLFGIAKENILACAILAVFLAAAFIIVFADTIIYFKTPTDLIIKQGEYLIFKGMTFKINEVRLLTYTQTLTAYSNLNRGTIILSANGKKYRLRFVDDIAKAANDLSRLTLEYSSVKKA